MIMRKRLKASAAAAVLGGLFAPGSAHAGFFEQLFGIQAPAPQTAPESSYGYETAPRLPRVHRRKHLASVENRTGRQTPTDIMHDTTLRPGDAVMMKTGIRVYEGDRALHHDSDDFVALDDSAVVTRKQREVLVAIDTTRNDPLRGEVAPDTIASGRSASVSTPVSAGYRITDVRGKSLRYVGP